MNNLVEGSDERYRFERPGKKASILKANTPLDPPKTLRPYREESKDFENTENLYLEGDNFEILKILQESYLNQVKMIYIDPPYNTGKDFVYKDNFKKSKNEYEKEIGAVDEEGRKLFKNTDTNGRFHSDWLSMMYERLTVARDLLKDDGVIFISIDDNEVHNLRKICDEIFGEENFIYTLTVINNLNGNNNSSGMMETHEYCLIYTKNVNEFEVGVLRIEDKEELDKWKKDELGYWKEGRSLKATGISAPRERSPNLFFPLYIDEINLTISTKKDENHNYEIYPITDGKEMSWNWSKEKYQQNRNEVIVKRLVNGGYSLYKKQRPYIGNLPSKRGKTTFYKSSYSNTYSSNIIKELFDGWKAFYYSKSVELIKDLLQIGNLNNNDIILDFFSGSATTAHAVMQLNAEDGGNRKFIMAQLPEETNKKSEAYNAGYSNISEIGKERIRRAANKIQEDFKENLQNRETPLDTGFRVYKLDTTNMKDVYCHPNEIDQNKLLEVNDNIKEDRTAEDLLTQVMLDLGLTLDLPIQKQDIKGNQVYFVAGNSLVACFDEQIDVEIVDEIANQQPLKVVFRDGSFRTDSEKINFETRFQKLSPETQISVI